MSSQARKLADLLNSDGTVKKENLSKINEETSFKTLETQVDTNAKMKTKFNLNLGVTDYMEK